MTKKKWGSSLPNLGLQLFFITFSNSLSLKDTGRRATPELEPAQAEGFGGAASWEACL